MLTCYICGTQHGLSSLLIHQKQCAVKFEKQHRKPCGAKPTLGVPTTKAKMAEVEAYNAEAAATHAASMPKCHCGRSFATEDKLATHAKSCKGGKKAPPTKTESHSAKLFAMIDTDGSGSISLDELMEYQLGWFNAILTPF